jgi:hypothetical protein
MASHNSPEQQARSTESAEFIRAFTNVGNEMANFSLNDLESRLAGELNQDRIDNITEAEHEALLAIAVNFEPLLTDQPSIESYQLDQFKADFAAVAEFFNEPLKTEILTLVNGVDATAFATIQSNFDIAATNRRSQQLRSATEHLTLVPSELNNEQRNLLRNVPNIGSLTEQVSREMENAGVSLESPQAMERLIELVTEQAYNELAEIYNTNMQLINQVQQQQNQGDLNNQINEALNIEVEGVLNVSDQMGQVTRFLGGIGGFQDINQNPLITSLLTPEARQEFNNLFVAAAGSAGQGVNMPASIREMVDTNVRRILTGVNLTDTLAHFHTLNTEPGSHPNPEVIRRAREIMVAKLRTVPPEWQNTVEAERYEEYVLANGVDSFDFTGAMERGYLGEVSFLRKMIMMFKGLWKSVIGAFSGEEELDQWERIEHYKVDISEGDEEGGGLDTDDQQDAQRMLAALSEQVSENGYGDINILKNGAPFNPTSPTDLAALESISRNFSFTNHPDRLRILTLGLEIEDLRVMADQGDDLRGDRGFNVNFTPEGFSLDLDWENAGWKQYIDDVLLVGGGVAATAYFVSNPVGWFSALVFAVKVGLGGGAAMALNELINVDEFITTSDESFEYDNFSPVHFRAALENVQAKAGLIEAAFSSINPEQIGGYIQDFESKAHRFDMENISSFPPRLFGDTGISPAFNSLLDLDDAFWGDYQMTQADIDAFATHLDTGVTDWGYVDNEAEAFETNDAWNPLRRWRGGFLVEGGTFMDNRFDTVEEFFTWLRS